MTQSSLTHSNLTPGAAYVLLVRAVKNNGDGTKSYSDFASIPYVASTTAPSGLNQLILNNGSDMLLNGGSIYAQDPLNPFPANVGNFDLINGNFSKGQGVVINNTGIAAFKSGISGAVSSKQFYLDAKTGNAYFAGTLSASSITSAGGLTSIPSNYLTTTSTITGGQITTGVIQSGFYPGTGSSVDTTFLRAQSLLNTSNVFSNKGSAFYLDHGAIITPNFSVVPTVTVSGSNMTWVGSSAWFKGNFTTSSATGIDKITIGAGTTNKILFESSGTALTTPGSVLVTTNSYPLSGGGTGYIGILNIISPAPFGGNGATIGLQYDSGIQKGLIYLQSETAMNVSYTTSNSSDAGTYSGATYTPSVLNYYGTQMDATIRNIAQSTAAPPTSAGYAAAFKNGDIWIVYA